MVSDDEEQITAFQSTMDRLLMGHPIGHAIEYFNERYAALSSELTSTLERQSRSSNADPYELAQLWTANNDARGYIVIGDPAVRLPVAKSTQEAADRLDL